MLIAVIAQPNLDAARAEIEKAKDFAQGIELRLDCLESFEGIRRLISENSLPFIFTFRRKNSISEKRRLEQLKALLKFQPAYCDLEADTDPRFIEQMAKQFLKIQFIGSYHNFEGMPFSLETALESMKNPHFSAYKIAVRAHSSVDLIRLLAFARAHSAEIPLSCIALGEAGRPSRVLGPIVGNAFDYASVEEEKEVLFRYSLKTLCEQFHFDGLSCDTKIYALIGDPVEQSPGDRWHNEIFRRDKRNAVYVKVRLSPEELSSFFHLLPSLPFQGLSVTTPLKERVIPFLHRLAPMATAIGAVNTISVSEGCLIGTNTDAPGALNAIERYSRVKDQRVAILGAGGTARAVAYEAKERGAKVHLYNRTAARAKKVAADLSCEGGGLEEIAPCDFLVNTIPFPAEEPLKLPKAAIAMDAIYFPRETPFLRAAKAQGFFCIYGEEMFLEQARLQQEEWFNRR